MRGVDVKFLRNKQGVKSPLANIWIWNNHNKYIIRIKYLKSDCLFNTNIIMTAISFNKKRRKCFFFSWAWIWFVLRVKIFGV